MQLKMLKNFLSPLFLILCDNFKTKLLTKYQRMQINILLELNHNQKYCKNFLKKNDM